MISMYDEGQNPRFAFCLKGSVRSSCSYYEAWAVRVWWIKLVSFSLFSAKFSVLFHGQCLLAELWQRDSKTKGEFSAKKAVSVEFTHLVCLTQTGEASNWPQFWLNFTMHFCTEQKLWILFPITYTEIALRRDLFVAARTMNNNSQNSSGRVRLVLFVFWKDFGSFHIMQNVPRHDWKWLKKTTRWANCCNLSLKYMIKNILKFK